MARCRRDRVGSRDVRRRESADILVERKQEARNPYVRLVEVNEETTDPAAWGVNWRRDTATTCEPPSRARRDSRVGNVTVGESQCVSVAHTRVCRLCLRPRLSRSAGARPHAPGPGADEASHRTAAAGLLSSVSRLGDPNVSSTGRGRHLQGVRSARPAFLATRTRKSSKTGCRIRLRAARRRPSQNVRVRTRWRRRLSRSCDHGVRGPDPALFAASRRLPGERRRAASGNYRALASW